MNSELVFALSLVAVILWKIVSSQRNQQSTTRNMGVDEQERSWQELHRHYWGSISSLWKEYWTDPGAKVFPIVVFVIMIDITLWYIYPTWLWEPVVSDWRFVVMLHVFYCVALTGLSFKPVWKKRTAMILIITSVLALTTRTLEITPWLGENWWIGRAQENAVASDPSNPTTGIYGERIYTAPKSPEWSTPIKTPGTAWYNPAETGKIRLNGDDKRVYDIRPNGQLWFDGKIDQLEFQSGSGATMKVAVATK